MILRDRKYLDYLRTQSCLFTGAFGTDYETVDPAHIGTAGKGIKSPDNEAIPLLHSIHVRMHKGEISAIRELAPDWLIREAFRAYARQMYQEWKATQKP